LVIFGLVLVIFGLVLVIFGLVFERFFDYHFWARFSSFFFGRPLPRKLPVSLGFLRFWAASERFVNFGIRMTVCLMPAVLKGVLVPLRPGRVLDRTFAHHFGGHFGPPFLGNAVLR
jgi:hypothetical protein